MSKLLSGLLSLVMVFSLMPSTIVLAEDTGTSETETETKTETETGTETETEPDPTPEPVHTHTLELTQDGNRLTGKCTGEDCDYSVELISFKADDSDFTGKAYAKAKTVVDEENKDRLTISDIEYKEASADDSSYTTTGPIQVGDYVARVKVTYSEKTEEAEEAEEAEETEETEKEVEPTEYVFTKSFHISNFIPFTEGAVTITKGGTYEVKGSYFVIPNHALVIDTNDDVILNLHGMTEYVPSTSGEPNIEASYIEINNANSVTINGKEGRDYNVPITTNIANHLITLNSDTELTLNDCILNYDYNAICQNVDGDKPITLNRCKLNTTYAFGSCGIYAKNLHINNCVFTSPKRLEIWIKDNGNVTFENENEITNKEFLTVELDKDSLMTLKDSFNLKDDKKIGIKTYGYPIGTAKIKFTTNTSRKMVNKIVSDSGYYQIVYDDGDFYLWTHKHDWSYVVKDNVLTAICNDDTCAYHTEGLTVTLDTKDVGYTGKAYDQATITNYIPQASVGSIEYYSGSTKLDSAPKDVGKYTASVTVTCEEKEYTITKDFEITNPISPSSETVTITKGGDYTIVGGTYSSKTDTNWNYNPGYALVINTQGEDVTLNISGDIVDKRYYGGFIKIEKGCGNVTINAQKEDGTNYNVQLNGWSGLFVNSSDSTIVLNGGNYTGKPAINSSAGTVKIKECVFNDSSYFNAVKLIMHNCVIHDGYQIYSSQYGKGQLTLSGSNTDIGDSDSYIFLYNGATITIKDNFKNKDDKKINVMLSSSLGKDKLRKVTTDTSEDMMDAITSNQGYKMIYKDGDIYFFNHEHDWKYTADKNVLIANCSNEDCEYHTKDLKATLEVKSGPYTGKAYTASLDSDKKAFEDVVIQYYKDDEKLDEAPKEVGTYKATATIGDACATADFEIKDESLSIASIFGKGNLILAAGIVIVLGGIGFGVYKKKKKD